MVVCVSLYEYNCHSESSEHPFRSDTGDSVTDRTDNREILHERSRAYLSGLDITPQNVGFQFPISRY